MPRRVRASARQLEFIADLGQLPDVILNVKGGEHCAVNAHGRFGAFEKHWANADTDPDETLLALDPAAGGGSLTPSGDPRVHVHVDWNAVRWAIVRRRVLPLVGTDHEIVLCTDRDLDTRITTFFVRTGDPLRAFVGGLGTGGTLMGNGRRFKEVNPETLIVAAEPKQGELVQGLRSLDDGFIPPIIDISLFDRKIMVDNRDAIVWTKKLLDEEGVFAGVSGGAIAAIAARIAGELDSGNVVFLIPDDGWKYLSSGVYTKPIEEIENLDSTVWW